MTIPLLTPSLNSIGICFRGIHELCSGNRRDNLTITADVYQEDKTTQLGGPYSIPFTGDPGSGDYSGVIPSDVIPQGIKRFFIRIFMDGGAPEFRSTLWIPRFEGDRVE